MRRSSPRSRLRLWQNVSPLHRSLAIAIAAMAGLVAALLGQHGLDVRQMLSRSWVLLAGGAVAFALAVRTEALEQARPTPGTRTEAPRALLMAVALALAAVAYPGFAGNRFRLLPTVLWLGSLLLLYVAFRPRAADIAAISPRPTFSPQGGEGGCLPLNHGEGKDHSSPLRCAQRRLGPLTLRGEGVRISWHALLLIAIVAVGAFVRLYQLDAIPREMGVDMPLKYENAREIMEGQFMIFCPRYPGREALFFYLLALYGKVFGLSFFAIKFTTAAIGIATIPALYGLGRYLFERRVGLVAAALLAVNKWHVILSRSGYRSVLVPLFIILLLAAVVRALRRRRSSDFVLAGVVLGLGMYTYNAFWIVPLVLAVALLVELLLAGKRAWMDCSWGLVALALAALLTYLPLAHYALEYPHDYWQRVASRVTGAEASLPRGLLGILAGNYWRAMGMFNLRGDGVFYINVPYQRELGGISATLFLCGLGYALWRWRCGHYAIVLIFLAGMILPTALAVAFPNEVPSAQRASGVLTPALLLAALVPVLAVRQLGALWGQAKRLSVSAGRPWRFLRALSTDTTAMAVLALMAMAGVELRETWRAYFTDYVRHLPQRNYAISLELARTLDEFEPVGPSYIKVWPYWFDGNALRAQLKVKSKSWDWELSELDASKPPLTDVRGQVLFICHPNDREALETLKSVFPCGIAINHYDYDGRPAYVTFYAER